MYRITLIILSAICLLCGCSPSQSYRKLNGEIWTTSYSVTYLSDINLDDSIQAVLIYVDSSLSPFKDSSAVSALNSGGSDVSNPLLKEMITLSKVVNSLTHGRFDPTVAPLVNLWGFGYRKAKGIPDSAAIAQALTRVGIGRCSLSGDSLIKGHPLMELNFSAIAKGYACDLVGRMLQRHGVDNYLIEIGGEIVASGINSRGEPWHIQIDAPVMAPGHEPLTVVGITDCALATSGNYRNYRRSDSLTVWHTIDPATGYPAVTTTLSASVIAPRCALADALATACMAMPPREALRLIADIDSAECMLVVAQPDSGFRTLSSPGFPDK